MEVLGLQASPRAKGNSDILLETLLRKMRCHGSRTRSIQVAKKKIKPCLELTVCESKGTCPIKDEMQAEIYAYLRQAEIVVVSTPVFFYNVPAQFKALIDRSQALWARKYRLKLRDPRSGVRRGFLLAVGATSGARLFEGLELTTRYFFDAIDAVPAGSLTYKGIESRGQILDIASLETDIEQAAAKLCGLFKQRRKVLVLGMTNDSVSAMAAAFLQFLAGKRLDVLCAGLKPADAVRPEVIRAMAAAGLDLGFQKPRSIQELEESFHPDWLITTARTAATAAPSSGRRINWDFDRSLPVPQLMEKVETRVKEFLDSLS